MIILFFHSIIVFGVLPERAMDHPSSSSSPATKSRGYRHRSRSARRSDGATAKNDGKHSPFRHRPRSSNPKESFGDASIVIPFPVPSVLATRWLIRTAPVVLAQYLVYARGLWPMSVPQLMLLQDATNQEARSGGGLRSHNRSGHDGEKTSSKRQRLNKTNRTNPSLRRKQQRATDQIRRLSDEWARYMTAASHSGGNQNTNGKNEHRHEHDKLPKFLLILIGSSYMRGRELYLLDFQSLIDEDEETTDGPANDAGAAGLTQEQEQKYKSLLARKLVSALMNHRNDDEQPSVGNTLPAPTSASFRLWFTAGFENQYTREGLADEDEFLTGESSTNAGYIPTTTHCDSASLALGTEVPAASPFSTISWIPRNKFPLSKQNSRSRPSSQTQSLVTIRFVRSRKPNQGIQQPASKICNKETKDSHISTVPNQLPATSERLTWMSLPNHLKGFRL